MVMRGRMRIAQLHKRQKDFLYYGFLAALALVLFLLVGSREPVLFDDSASYLKIEDIEGVMPVYPLFLFLNQWIFGNDIYLRIVIAEQALLAAFSILFFVREIKNRFALREWEGCLLFLLSLMPYTIEMPQAMMTQTILTEGLAYSLFYLLSILFLRAVWKKSYPYLAASYAMVFLLAMLRSQLQILFGVCGVLFLYLTWHKCGGGWKKWAGTAAGLAGCLVIGISGVFLTVAAADGYSTLVRGNLLIMKIQEPEYYRKVTTGERQIKKKTVSQEQPVLSGQYTTLLFSRGMYEADEEDVQLFSDDMTREFFQTLYAAADDEGERYVYAQKSLWMWKDIVGGIGSVGKTAFYVGRDYFREKQPQIYESSEFNAVWNRSLQTIGIALLKKHFGRFLYHTLMLLPQAFICTVFFQIAPLYLLCHLITLFLYLSAAALMIWGYADKRVPDSCAEFMALVLGSNLVMIAVISVVFFGQQRYLVYNFGIFYMAYYVLVRELFLKVLKGKRNGKEGKGIGHYTGV